MTPNAAEVSSLAALEVCLRPAAPEDLPLLSRIYASTRTDELSLVPWTAEQKAAFLEQQFLAQDADYRRNYADASFSVIEVRGVPAGRLYVDRGEREMRVVDISLLPEFRGKGLGGGLLAELIEESRGAGRRLTLHVERFNPALRLYRRLGFRLVLDLGVYVFLEWSGDEPLSPLAPQPPRFPEARG
jgi:ribosomal protein S18 acetylase RimI-like enzyme